MLDSVLKYRCSCGWKISSPPGLRTKCGQCGRAYAITATRLVPTHYRLGDCVAAFTRHTGIDRMVKALTRGKDCGCSKRREQLNELAEAFAPKSKPAFDATYVAQPRSVQLIRPRILHPLPVPRSERALCVIAVDARSQAELAITRPFMQDYAAKVGIDYVEVSAVQAQEHPVGNKYAVLDVAPRYLQTLLIDADVVITPESPNIFDHVPAGHWAMVDDLAKHTDTSWLVSEMRGIEAALELPERPVTKAWNSGVCIMPTDAELVYHPPPRPVPYTWCAEQHYHTICLHRHIADGTASFTELPDLWNAGWPWLDWPELIRRAHFLHVNGCVHPTRLDFLRHLASGSREIPDALAEQCFRETPWCEWARARATAAKA